MAARRRHVAATSILNATLTAIPYDTEDYSDGIVWDAGQSVFVAPSDGYYDVEFGLTYTANATGVRVVYIQVNGLTQSTIQDEGTAGAVAGSSTVKALAGQTIQIKSQQTSGGSLALAGTSTYNFVAVTKVPVSYAGSAVSTYGERNYSSSRRQLAAVSLVNNTQTMVPWDTEDFTDGVPFAAGVFTAPVSGYYNVNVGLALASGPTAGILQVRVLVNGGTNAVGQYGWVASNGNSSTINRTVKLNAGDTIQINALQNSGSTQATSTSSGYNFVNITKVPAPVINGAAASGVWGVGPLAGLGSNDLIGREVYIDSKGQLRAKPEILAPRTARRKSVSQTMATASTWYTVTFDVDVEVNTSIAYSNGAFTIPQDGVYQINTALLFGGLTAGGQTRARILIDGNSMIERVDNYTATGAPAVLSKSARMTAGQIVTIAGWATVAGGNVTGSTGAQYTVVDITRISA